MAHAKARINLKYKEIDGGRKSLYLDYYSNGKRIRESLRLYLLPETSRKAKAENKAVIQKAMEIQRHRLEELTASENNVEIIADVPDIPLADIVREYHAMTLERGDKSTATISWGCGVQYQHIEARMSYFRRWILPIVTVWSIFSAMIITASTVN